MNNQPQGAEGFQILSLDGGGIKGIFSAALLAAIEDDLGTKVTDHFDLIAGTSTGGIIALGLGLGLTPRQIVEFYFSWGGKIFSNRMGWRSLLQWTRRKYSPAPLETALKSCFGDQLFGASSKRLVIPSYNLGEDDVYIFRTPHHERLKRDFKVPAWKVAMATTAAPTFFPGFRGVDSQRLIDGGVWANNPTMVALVEAYGTLGIPLSGVRVLSVGTTDVVTCRPKRLNSGGLLAWAWGNSAVEVIMRGQSIAARNQAAFLVGAENMVRLDPKVAAAEFTLDGVGKAEDLIGKAAHHSRLFMPTFRKIFAGHRAAPFVPYTSNPNSHADINPPKLLVASVSGSGKPGHSGPSL
ncbi:MAG TPA: CBASS cGAMP-activated phospholipase [Clostridia bacterium]|nr:CBASS cGAMP-activated phospholipase [Clostridia bacterium]